MPPPGVRGLQQPGNELGVGPGLGRMQSRTGLSTVAFASPATGGSSQLGFPVPHFHGERGDPAPGVIQAGLPRAAAVLGAPRARTSHLGKSLPGHELGQPAPAAGLCWESGINPDEFPLDVHAVTEGK